MAAEPFQSLAHHAQRHERLRAVFQRWHDIIKDLPKFGDPPLLASLTVGDIGADGKEANTFAVTFAGTTMYVRFDYRPDGEYGTDGVLQPYVLEVLTDVPRYLPPVTFKGTGETKIRTQLGDSANLGERADAFVVLGSLLQAAIERK